MKYLSLVYLDQKKMLSLPRSEFDAVAAETKSFFEEVRSSGRVVTVQLLQPAQAAATVRKRDGKLFVTDGPFTETKEQLAGFVLLEADDFNDAIRFASSLPGAKYGSIEVRPVAEGFKDLEPYLTGDGRATGS